MLRIAIQEQTIGLEVQRPTNALDWFEQRYAFVLDEFRKTFKPAFVYLNDGEGIRDN